VTGLGSPRKDAARFKSSSGPNWKFPAANAGAENIFLWFAFFSDTVSPWPRAKIRRPTTRVFDGDCMCNHSANAGVKLPFNIEVFVGFKRTRRCGVIKRLYLSARPLPFAERHSTAGPSRPQSKEKANRQRRDEIGNEFSATRRFPHRARARWAGALGEE